MKITLKGVPPSLNRFLGRNAKWAYRNEKEARTALVLAACINAADKPKTPYTFALIRIDYFFPDMRRRDPDNYCGKLLLDGLTKAKVITDDDFAHIALALHSHVDRNDPRTEITIIPMVESEAYNATP